MQLFFSFIVWIAPLFFLSGCGKKNSLALASSALSTLETASLDQPLPTPLEKSPMIKKIGPSPRQLKLPEQAALTLQIALGLRDAARDRAHKIPALMRGQVFRFGGISTHSRLTSTYLNEMGECYTSTLQGELNQQDIIFTQKEPAKPAELPFKTILEFTPAQASTIFPPDFLDQIAECLESGYASNEISLMLTSNNRESNLCRRGGERKMKIDLQPEAITYTVEGYGLEPRVLLATLFDIHLEPIAPAIQKENIMSQKVLFIVMPRNFQDIEFSVPYNHLNKAGYITDVAGLSSGPCIGSSGLHITPTNLLSAMAPADFDQYAAVIIPGGSGSPTFLWDNEEVQAVVRYFHEHKKLVATICWACVVPARAGILQGRKATVYPSEDALEIFNENNVQFEDSLCIPLEKERIITAQSPKAAELFAEHILKQLQPHLVEKETHG